MTFSIKTEKGNTASEKNNYNFRRANFYAMRTELDYLTFEQPIIRNNAELGFEILKSMSQWRKQKTPPEKTSRHQQSIVDQQ